MGLIDYGSSRFAPGAVVTAAGCDAVFAEVATEVSSLTRDNFRKTSGFSNKNKASPYSPMILVTNIPSLTFDHTISDLYVNVFAYPHNENIDQSSSTVPLVNPTQLVQPFKINRAQLAYSSIAGNDASDGIYMVTTYVKSSTKNPGFGSVGGTAPGGVISSFAANTISYADYTIADAVAVCVQLRFVPVVSTSGTRTVTNLTCTLDMSILHV